MNSDPKSRFRSILRSLAAEYDLLHDQVALTHSSSTDLKRRLRPAHLQPSFVEKQLSELSNSLVVEGETRFPGSISEGFEQPPIDTAVSEMQLSESLKPKVSPPQPLMQSLLSEALAPAPEEAQVPEVKCSTVTSLAPPANPSEFCPPTPVSGIRRHSLRESEDDSKRSMGALNDPAAVIQQIQYNHRLSHDDPVHSSSPSKVHIAKLKKAIAGYSKAASFKEEGMFAAIAKSKSFEVFTLSMVILNGIWIGIDTDYNQAAFLLDADPVFQVVENLFCTVFTAEVVIRFLAFKRKRAALHDVWFIFDSVLVLMMVLDTWVYTVVVVATSSGSSRGVNMSVLRLLRLVRLSRLTRVIRAFPELSFMVKGVLQAARSVGCTLSLLIGILYVFGIAMRQLSIDTPMGRKYFGSIPHAVFTLFAQGTLLDSVSSLLIEVHKDSPVCALVLMVVIVISALTLMNMLVGVLCEVMNHVAASEKERMAMNFVSEQIGLALRELDKDEDGLISRDEFEYILTNHKAAEALSDIGVDVLDLVEFADFFFQSDKHGECFDEKWSFEKFMEKVMQVRGVNAATVRDIVDLRKFIHTENTLRNATLKVLHDNQVVLAKNQTKLDALLRYHSSTMLTTAEDSP